MKLRMVPVLKRLDHDPREEVDVESIVIGCIPCDVPGDDLVEVRRERGGRSFRALVRLK